MILKTTWITFRTEFIYWRNSQETNIVVSILEPNLPKVFYTLKKVLASPKTIWWLQQERSVNVAKARLDAGESPKNDYQKAQSQAATNKYNVNRCKKTITNKHHCFKQLLELPPNHKGDGRFETIDKKYGFNQLWKIWQNDDYNNALVNLPEIKGKYIKYRRQPKKSWRHR